MIDKHKSGERYFLMSKSPCNQRCVHCLGVFDTLTWDHIPPESWKSGRYRAVIPVIKS